MAQAPEAKGMMQSFDRWTGIRSGERKLAYGAFATQLLLGAGHAELETARDTVFLTRLTAAQLPFMYLAVAVLGFFMTEVNRRSMLRGQRTRTGLTGFLVVGGIVSAGFALLRPTTPTIYALYLWSALCGPWAVLQFSLQLAEELSVEQAKRLLGFVGAGAVLGAVVGSGLARIVLEFASSRSLVVSAGAFFFLAGVGPARLSVVKEKPTGNRREAYRTTRTEASNLVRDRYGRGLLLLMLSSTVALTLGDFFFKSEASRVLSGSHHLAQFLSTTQLVTNLVSLFVQVFAVAGLLRALGAHGALLLLPVFLLGGTAVLGTGAGFLGALLIRGADGSLRYSVHRTAVDILYFPLPDGARRRMKPVLEILGQRGGQAGAALTILGVVALPVSDGVKRWLLLGSMVAMLLLWCVISVRLRRPYVELFKSTLALSRGLPPAISDRELALPVLEAAVASLNSQSPREVMTALSLLSNYRDGKLLPALILYHPDPAVLERALDLFAQVGRQDVLPLVDRLLKHSEVEVRSAALRARLRLAPDEEMLRRFVADAAHPELAGTALVGLVAHEWMGYDEAKALIASWAQEQREFVLALAQAALVVGASPPLALVLGDCLDAARSQQEQAAVAAALARNPCPSTQRNLVALLAFRIPRESARDALVALGEPALDELASRLEDGSTPHEVRRHLPESIRRFPMRSAVKVLQRQLGKESDGMVRFKLLRSLNRLRRANPDLPLDEVAVGTLLQRTLDQVARSIKWREALRNQFEAQSSSLDLEMGPPSQRFTFLSASLELLIEVLHDKEQQATERVLRLANLLLPLEDFRPVALGLRSRIPARRATAYEVLSSSLPLRFREAVLQIVRYTFQPPESDEDDDERRALPFTDERMTGEEALRQIVREEGVTLKALALNAAAEIGYPWVEDAFAEERTPTAKPSAVKLYEAAKAMHVVSSRPSLPTLEPEPT